MPVFMMTSVETLYEVTVQDTHPINQLGAPRIDAMFHGLTQIALQNPDHSIYDKDVIESSFKQQQKYLSDASQVAVNLFNPVKTGDFRFRATLKLTPTTGKTQAFELDSDSVGLAYTLAFALTWGDRKNLFSNTKIPETPIFATGCVPLDGYVKPIGHLLNKIRHVCDYIESYDKATFAKENIPSFYILIPSENLSEYHDSTTLNNRINSLGGEVIGTSHVSEALQLLMGDNFDGGIFTNIDSGFPGLSSIPYEKRHLFMGREELTHELLLKSQMAIEQDYILNVTGVSGSGKSSAVMAGLVPQLLAQIDDQAPVFDSDWTLIRPSQFSQLDDLLKELLGSLSDDQETISQWLTLKHQPEQMAEVVFNYIQHKASLANNSRKYLWVIDQYEEIFTHGQIPLTQAQKLFPLLATLTENIPVLVVTILRTEYLGALGGQISIDVQLPRRIQTKEIERIIALQLQYHRLDTQSSLSNSSHNEQRQHLDNRIKNDATGKPLTTVSYLLQQMHQQMVAENPSSTTLTHQHYEAVGGIDGVMARQAELALTEGLSGYEQSQHKQLTHTLFEAFVGADDNHPIAKALPNAHIEHYPAPLNALIQAFMSKGLIIDCGRGSSPKIKLAHDTLLSHQTSQPHWQRLLTWFEKHSPYLLWKQEIEPQFLKWLSDRDKHYLLKDDYQLERAKKLNAQHLTSNTLFKSYIEQSQYARQREKIKPWAIAAVVLLLAGAGIWDQYFRIKQEYVALLGERYGIPFGVNELNTIQRKKRQFHYRLSYRGGQLIALSHHNSSGFLINDITRENAARWQYDYTANGDLLNENSFAQNGKRLKSKSYEFTPAKNAARVRFKSHGTQTSIGDALYQSSSITEKNSSKSQITQHRLSFDSQGYVTKQLFFNSSDQPAKDSSGVYGIKLYYNPQGLISEQEYIGLNDEKVSIKGVYKKQLNRDKRGYIIGQMWINKQGKPVINQGGYSQSTRLLDEYGNIIERAFFDTEGNPTLHKNGYARLAVSYDNSGNQIEQSALDINGQLTLYKSGFARAIGEYDEKGNQIQWQYFGTDGKPSLRNNGFSRITVAYDDNGNRTAENYFGIDGKPSIHKDGYASFTARYDAVGNRTEQSYYGADGKLTLHSNGYARYTATYDQQGNRVEEKYFETNGNPTLHTNGYARATATYNKRGNKVQWSYYGLNNQLTLHNYGYARYRAKYDEFGNRSQVSFYGNNDKAINNKYGFAHIKYMHDTKGNILEWSYYDIADKLTLHQEGVSKVKANYDEKGNRIGVAFFGLNGKPVLRNNSFARISLSYNTQGNIVEWAYFGIDDNPIRQKKGYSRARIDYDLQGNRSKITYYDVDGSHIATRKYNK